MKELKDILKTVANEEYSNGTPKYGPKWLTVYDIILSSKSLVYFNLTPQFFVHNTVFLLLIY